MILSPCEIIYREAFNVKRYILTSAWERDERQKRHCKLVVKVGECRSFWGTSNNIKARTSGYKIQRGKVYRGSMMIDDFRLITDNSPYHSTHPPWHRIFHNRQKVFYDFIVGTDATSAYFVYNQQQGAI
jgi:hypothetical protein